MNRIVLKSLLLVLCALSLGTGSLPARAEPVPFAWVTPQQGDASLTDIQALPASAWQENPSGQVLNLGFAPAPAARPVPARPVAEPDSWWSYDGRRRRGCMKPPSVPVYAAR